MKPQHNFLISFLILAFLIELGVSAPNARVNSPYHPHRIAIVCQQTFRQIRRIGEPEQLFQTLGYKTLSLYARMHGYDFITLPYFPVFNVTAINGMSLNNQPGWVKVFWTRTQMGSSADGSSLAQAGEDIKAVCKKYDWFVWMDSDIFITNFQITVEEIIEEAKKYTKDKNYPHFIAAAHGFFDKNGVTFNTGTAFVRCSDESLRLLNFILNLRQNKREDLYVRAWDMQGPLITARQIDPVSRNTITLIPSKLINSAPYINRNPNGTLRECPPSECDEGWWTPGDLLVHFPGAVKEYPKAFLDKYPPSTWLGWREALDPLREGR